MGKKKSRKYSKEKVMKKQAEARTRNIRRLTMFTLVGLLLAAGIYALLQWASDDQVQTAESRFQYERQPVMGDPNAPVKIVEFADYKCPYCKRFKDEIFPRLKKDFIEPGHANLYFINNPFIGDDSVTAGLAGEAVYKQDKDAFWKYFEAVYAKQGPEHQTWATPEFLVELVKKEVPGIDIEQLKKDMEEKTYLKEVEADKRIAGKLGVNSVPTLFINGKKVENALDYEAIQQVIQEELKQAHKEKKGNEK